MKSFIKFLCLATLIISCSKDGVDGNTSLIDIQAEPSGENCSTGGLKVITGIDINNNNVLEKNEIQNTEYICSGENGIDGYLSLTYTQVEPSGENCSTGGLKINTGIDINSNNFLEENEIQNTEYICNGENGIDGYSSLMDTQVEPSGENCSTGGLKINTGIDINSNNVLEENEIQHTEYICNGENGIDGYSSLMDTQVEPSGENCSTGGLKINTGIDINSNNVLEDNEIQNTEYICNGENGIDGYSSLMDIQTEPSGENCQNGGTKIISGIDLDFDGNLDETEVQSVEYICSVALGEAIMDYELDVAYKAETDGFLTVLIYNSNGMREMGTASYIYCDYNEMPSTKVSQFLSIPGSKVIPVQKDKYWRVHCDKPGVSAVLSWIPIVNN